ncbi:hypothetical protein PFLmoz3_05434 [Pseudomonas fluorescens]|uniref:Uncharacterized protein n=1 Tax=Pseudomonas fluorescens TaxID=294 RepID=A0A109LCF6_PSEFL|nr:hypothetical protein PFLmoz3_05434 [Pseudomonas fluorescens]
MGPVQALAYHRALVPIQSVDKARRTIHRPGVLAGTGEQAFGVAHQPVRRGQLGLEARSFKVQQQPRPFETMAGGDAVGAKAIGGVVLVVTEQRLPVRIEMFDDHELVASGVGVDHPFDDAQRTVQPTCITTDIGQCQESFGGVHVAVGATIGFDAAPVPGKGFEHDALLFAPEELVDDMDGVVH